MPERTFVVVNPASSNGRTGKRWSVLEEQVRDVLGELEIAMTTQTGDGIRLAKEAAAAGFNRIVSVGGDGTHSEVVGGLMEAGGGQTLIPLTSGTGGDFRKTFGVGPGPEAALERIRKARPVPLDVGEFTFVDHDGKPGHRFFVNILSLGLGGLVDERVNNTSKALGGKTSFFIGTLRALMAYRNVRLRLRFDEEGDWIERKTLVTALANGQFFGGGMHIAPEAAPGDGLLDVVILGDIGKFELMRMNSSIYKGTHLTNPKVEQFRAKVVEVESDDVALLDVDGEPVGSAPIRVTLRPGALSLLA